MTSVHTKAIQNVLEPIADSIGKVICECNDLEKEGKALPDLTLTSAAIGAAVSNFAKVGREDIQDTKDDVLRSEMEAACQLAESSIEKLKAATNLLAASPHEKVAYNSLIEALKSILISTQNILVASDDAEVRSIVTAATDSQNLLELVKEIKTDEDLLTFQEALSRTLMVTCRRAQRRVEDLFEQRHKDRLLDQTEMIKSQTPLLFSAIRSTSSNATTDANRALVIKQLNKAMNEIIELVEMRAYLPNWADGIGKIVEKFRAATTAIESINPTQVEQLELEAMELSLNELLAGVEALLDDPKLATSAKENLAQKINDVKVHHTELKNVLEQLLADPDNVELQRQFAMKKAQYTKALEDLKQAQTTAAMQTCVEAFADPALTTKPLVNFAKAKDTPGFVAASRAFIAANKSMNTEAKNMAEHIEDASKAAEIRRAAVRNEEVLLPSVVHAGRVVLENPNDVAAKQHLEKMTQQWEDAKDKLESDIIKVVDPVAFANGIKMAIESNIKKMRAAIQNQDTEAFEMAKAKLQHLAKVSRSHALREAANTEDPVMKQKYLDASEQVETSLAQVVNNADAAFRANDAASLAQFDKSAQQLISGAQLMINAADHPRLEAERVAAAEAAEEAAQRAADLARKNEEEKAADRVRLAQESERIAKENEFNPTTEVGKTATGLRNEVNKWDTEGNRLVEHARNVTELTKLLGEYDSANNKGEMIKTAKLISKDAEGAAREAMKVCAQCTDKRLQHQLRVLAEKIPTQATQLKIIASVKAANPGDDSTDQQMVVCAKALMDTMTEMMRAVATASIRLKADVNAKETALVWKRKLDFLARETPVALANLM